MTGATSPMPPDSDAGRSHPSSVPGGEPTVIVVPRPLDVSEAAAEAIVAGLDAGIRERGRADFVTTGGSTPIGIYKVLSERLQGAIEWPRVHLWWGDDRFVPRDHPFSNVQPADAILLSIAQFAGQSGNQTEGIDVQEGLEAGLVVPVENIHPFPCTEAIAEPAAPTGAQRTTNGRCVPPTCPRSAVFPSSTSCCWASARTGT